MLDIHTARALLSRTRPTRNADGYPQEVRAEVSELASHLLREGLPISSIARELGLHRSTVVAWLDAGTASSPSFVPVVLADDAASDQEPVGTTAAETRTVVSSPSAPGRLTLVSPGGYRLEGLDLDAAIIALSRLG
ncbi:helix-turn-helix domain-containing protein [Oceanithermus sp.]